MLHQKTYSVELQNKITKITSVNKRGFSLSPGHLWSFIHWRSAHFDVYAKLVVFEKDFAIFSLNRRNSSDWNSRSRLSMQLTSLHVHIIITYTRARNLH